MQGLLSLFGGSPHPDLADGVRELREFIAEVGGTRIEPPEVRPEGVYVPMVASDGERYLLRIVAERYLAEPPQCAFVDPTYEPTETHWPHPSPDGPFRSPEFICTPPTFEFYRAHSERTYQAGEGTLVATVAVVFAALHAREYDGRYRAADAGRRRLRRPRPPA